MPEHFIVYVHVPFCSSKCHFCFWTSPLPASELVRKEKHSAEYAAAVVRQIKDTSARLKGRRAMGQIYFGGGTPSLMEARDLGAILDAIHEAFPKDEGFLDTTIEVAPETVDLEKLRALRAAGFNRISFGFQSLNERRVRTIGRAHSADQAIHAFHMAREAEFSNLNIDMMLGFPSETDEEWHSSLGKALELSPDHLSLYVYKQVAGTVMAQQIERGEMQAVPQEVSVRRYLEAASRLTDYGYNEYMFQLFARENKRCFVDQSYFNLACDFVGFGAGANSLFEGHVMGHSPHLSSYLQQPRFAYRFPVANAPDAINYSLFEMLHTDGGIDPVRFQQRLRLSVGEARERYPEIDSFLRNLEAAGLPRSSNGGWAFRDSSERATWLSGPANLYKPLPTTSSSVVQIAPAS